MPTADPILHVAVPSPLYRTFDYLAPAGGGEPPAPGSRVLVPFGRQRVVGVVLGGAARSDIDGGRLKRVIEVLDPRPLLDPELLALV
ncbi:MAG TPA: primosomal protein N', partial [Gammaproteobacteria bacterium]|nr:primosomal protein N' [Gammaproteobacteria bacterium]